jgi:hypothetical protein
MQTAPLTCTQWTEGWGGFKAGLEAEAKENTFVLPGIEFHSSLSHSGRCDSHYT